jgi:hypothetical protein
MAIEIPTSSVARPSKIYPNWDFWFENMPSGNPALGSYLPAVTVNGSRHILSVSNAFVMARAYRIQTFKVLRRKKIDVPCRVARGEFSPIGRLFSLGSSLKITD